MPRKLLSTLERFIAAEGLLPPGKRVAVAVSGGSDSMGLLLLLQDLVPRWGWQLTVLHFNHQLRAESSQEAELVRRLAARRGLECHVGQEDVQARMRLKEKNLEEAARQARYGFFAEICSGLGIDYLATGHTADDQAETVLFHLLRGSGPAGLAGIRPSSRLSLAHGGPLEPTIHLVRPLLWARRTGVRAFVEEAGEQWIEDPSNASLDRSRNRIRHQLLPLLNGEFNPATVERLSSMAEIFRGEEDVWDEMVETAMRGLPREPLPGGGFRLRLEPLRRMQPGMRRRVLRSLIESVQEGLRGMDFDHVQQLLQWIGTEPPASSVAGKGMRQMEFAGVRVEVTAHELCLRSRQPVSVDEISSRGGLEAPRDGMREGARSTPGREPRVSGTTACRRAKPDRSD